VSEDRSRQSRATQLGRERAQPLDKASKRPGPREERVALHCEIDGLPAELDRSELSAAGAFVVTTQPLQVDSEVAIFLRLGEQRFEMTGHVVHNVSWEHAAKSGKKPGYALLFTNLAAAERKRLGTATQSARSNSLQPRASRASGTPKVSAKASTPPKTSAAPKASTAPKAAPPPNREPAPAPQKPATPSYDAAELALLEQLKRELAQAEEKTAWALLGVSQGAEPERFKAAFFQASKRYHPHLFARYAHPEIKRLVTELFIAHKRAFTTMTKRGKKQP
jgi:hypothetical protein